MSEPHDLAPGYAYIGIERSTVRGGGPGAPDWLSGKSGAINCTQWCSWIECLNCSTIMNPGSGGLVVPARYAKCYERSFTNPKNNQRYAFASQVGTTEIDPALPQFYTGNGTICRGKIILELTFFDEYLKLHDTSSGHKFLKMRLKYFLTPIIIFWQSELFRNFS